MISDRRMREEIYLRFTGTRVGIRFSDWLRPTWGPRRLREFVREFSAFGSLEIHYVERGEP